MNNSKRLFALVVIVAGAVMGGFLFPPVLKLNFLGSAIAGALTALLTISIVSPNLVNEINPYLSEERKKRLAKVQFHGFKRAILHPIRLPVFIGVLWLILLNNYFYKFHFIVFTAIFFIRLQWFSNDI